MKFYSYVITRDYGFAPNPYFNYCTLATCKPLIRKHAQVGDWVAAYGPAKKQMSGKLVFLMHINEVLSLDQYWNDSRFLCKHPDKSKSVKHMYGDNIYHLVNNEWVQELSHHSMPDGRRNDENYNRDTGVDRMLISSEYYYFGKNAVLIPDEFKELIKRGRGHSICENIEVIDEFINYMNEIYDLGIHGLPFSRQEGKFAHYGGK